MNSDNVSSWHNTLQSAGLFSIERRSNGTRASRFPSPFFLRREEYLPRGVESSVRGGGSSSFDRRVSTAERSLRNRSAILLNKGPFRAKRRIGVSRSFPVGDNALLMQPRLVLFSPFSPLGRDRRKVQRNAKDDGELYKLASREGRDANLRRLGIPITDLRKRHRRTFV